MEIEFDEKKSARNIRERHLPFERAAEFDFDTALVCEDVRNPYPETRYVAVGFVDKRLHVLCFTPTRSGIRVISFRKANAREVRDYEKTRSAD